MHAHHVPFVSSHERLVFPLSFYSTHAGGFCLPEIIGLTLAHVDVVGPSSPWYVRSMSASTTPSHGILRLQISSTASLVAEVPRMFLKLILLSLILEGI